jgi:hypothetical protein
MAPALEQAIEETRSTWATDKYKVRDFELGCPRVHAEDVEGWELDASRQGRKAGTHHGACA